MSGQDIDVSGTLQNMLYQGFSINDCLCELIDNSIDAGATRIVTVLSSDNALMIQSDNGRGMDLVELKDAFKLNKRSEASNTKQGKYGIGGNQAMVNITKLQNATTTVSKKSDANALLNVIEIDWDACVKENVYFNRPGTKVHPSDKDMFNANVTQGFNSNSGTMHIIPTERNAFNQMCDGIKSKNITQSWVYDFGVKYHGSIKNGVSIKFIIDNVEYDVAAIDPLALDATPTLHKSTEEVEFYRTTSNELRAWFPERNGSLKYRKSGRGGKGVTTVIKNEPLESDSVKVASCLIEQTYVGNPETKIQELVDAGLFDSIISDKLYDQKATAHLNGLFFKRNDKIVKHFDSERPTSGDTAKYAFAEKSSCRITFGVEMDDYFSVQVNKSTLKEELFHAVVRDAYQFLHRRFIDEQYKIAYPPKPKQSRGSGKRKLSAQMTDSDNESVGSEELRPIQDEQLNVEEEEEEKEEEEEDDVEIPQNEEQEAPGEPDGGVNIANVRLHQRQYVTKERAMFIIEDIRRIISAQHIPYVIDELANILAITIGKGGDRLLITQWTFVGNSVGVQCQLDVLSKTYEQYSDNDNVIAGACLFRLHESLLSIQ